MNTERLKNQLRIDEGDSLVVYKDTGGHLTAGIGHLLRPFFIGNRVSQAQVDLWFEEDVSSVLHDCVMVFPAFDSYPEEVQEILANMLFQLGRSTFLLFNNLISAITKRNWHAAAQAMQQSLWAHQTRQRASRLIIRMRAVLEP